MGLRINTNVPSIGALRTLGINSRNQQITLERLATGLRINRASDDPSGSIISEQLRNQLSALKQAGENSQNASNMINVADAALQEVGTLLNQIQESVVFALNTGGATTNQILAEQATVDNAIEAIDRIANTTRFADRNLLNGSSDYQLVSSIPDLMDDVTIRRLDFPNNAATRDLRIVVTTSPTRGSIQINGAVAASSGASFRITGGRGSQDVTVLAGSTAASIAEAINDAAGFTGVFASATSGNVLIRSEEFGESQLVLLQGISGHISGTAGSAFQVLSGTSLATVSVGNSLTAGEIVSDRGVNGVVQFNGQTFEGVGRIFSILGKTAQFEFKLDPELLDDTPSISLPSPASATITVGNTGLFFQLNERPAPTDRIGIGIASMNVNQLGFDTMRDKIEESTSTAADTVTLGGVIDSIKTGAGNDLFQNAKNASSIVRASVIQVASLRGFLGAIDAQSIQPNIRSLEIHMEKLSASLSDLRDLDFADESANFARTQVLFQSGIGVLAAANAIPQAVLTLIGQG